MFPAFLFEYCRHFYGFDFSVKPCRRFCKAFPDGEGIPSDFMCMRTDFEVFDGDAELPKACPNGCSFESKYRFADRRVQEEIDRKNGLYFPDE